MPKVFVVVGIVFLSLAASDCAFGQEAMEKDRETARALAGHVELKWQELCAQKNGIGCTLYALAAMNGAGYVIKNEAKATSYLRNGCLYGDPNGCRLLGVALQLGRGAPVDLAGARSAFEQACTGKDAKGCTRLGTMVSGGVGGPADPARAELLIAQACALGDDKACPPKRSD